MGDEKALARVDSETAVVLDGITRAALDPSIDVAKLERLLAIQQTLLADQRRTAFRAALARLQERLPQIQKSGLILGADNKVRNRFAKIEDIDNAIRPLCAEEGFSFSFDSKTAGSSIEFTGTLHHREGHAETKTLTLPIDNGAGRNAVQSVGSTTSYARRYLLGMHLNLVTRDGDDDGMGGRNDEPITPTQVAELRKLLEESGGDPARFLKWLKVESRGEVYRGKEAAAGDQVILHDVLQGSTEWLAVRAGIPTASAFDRIVTPKGKPSTQSEKYMHALLAERIMGHPVLQVPTYWMGRGQQLEGEAVSYYEGVRDLDTTPIGFVTNDARTIGASPDRFVGEDGLLELKVPSEHVHVSYLLTRAVDAEYYPQVQGQLWVTGRRWLDIMSYHPEMPPAIVRVERDEGFIAILSRAIATFSMDLEDKAHELTERGWIKPKT
jgi:hypothetical protein